MEIIQFIFNLISTISIYCFIPALIAWRLRNLNPWVIRIIAIVNYIFAYGTMYLLTGDPSDGAAFLWSYAGYSLMKHYSLTKTTCEIQIVESLTQAQDANKVSESEPASQAIISTSSLIEKKKKFKYAIVIAILATYSIGISIFTITATTTFGDLHTEYATLENKSEILESSYYELRDYLSTIIYLHTVETSFDFITEFDEFTENDYYQEAHSTDKYTQSDLLMQYYKRFGSTNKEFQAKIKKYGLIKPDK